MGEPRIDVLGVYRPRITDEMFREQFRILYGRDASASNPGKDERDCRKTLESAVLIEVLVNDRDDRFDVGHFTQRQDGVARENWQVAWAEAYLSADGTALVGKQFGTPPASGDLRIAFYLHSWDPTKPLSTSYGDVICPAVTPGTDRLKELVPYALMD
jgi:hypothetical protein